MYISSTTTQHSSPSPCLSPKSSANPLALTLVRSRPFSPQHGRLILPVCRHMQCHGRTHPLRGKSFCITLHREVDDKANLVSRPAAAPLHVECLYFATRLPRPAKHRFTSTLRHYANPLRSNENIDIVTCRLSVQAFFHSVNIVCLKPNETTYPLAKYLYGPNRAKAPV